MANRERVLGLIDEETLGDVTHIQVNQRINLGMFKESRDLPVDRGTHGHSAH